MDYQDTETVMTIDQYFTEQNICSVVSDSNWHKLL